MTERESELMREVHELRTELASVKADVADLKAEVRLAKHASANVGQQQVALNIRLDKFEDKIGGKIDVLTEKVSAINTQQARGLGFFAGIGFMIAGVGGLLLALGKLLFGGHG